MKRLTGIGRPLDFSYDTNRGIVFLTLVTIIVWTVFEVFHQTELLPGALRGLLAGLAVFFSWALCRELDPDHDLSAFLAAGITLSLTFFWELPSLLVLLWILLLLRFVNGTTGQQPTAADGVLMLTLGGWLTWQENWGFGIITVLAFLINSVFIPGRWYLILAALEAALTVVLIFVRNRLQILPPTNFADVSRIAGWLLVLFLVMVVLSRKIASKDDFFEKRLVPIRIFAGQLLAILVVLNSLIWYEISGLKTIMPLAAAILGMLLNRLTGPLMRRKKTDKIPAE